jgi:hypothetical protein
MAIQTQSNKDLLDLSVRTQIYVEDVKLWQNAKFEPIVKELSENFKKVLRTSKKEDLSQLTKSEVNRLIAKLRISQSTIFNIYYEKILKDLKEFMKADLKVNQRVYSSYISAANKKEIKPLSQAKSIEFLLQQAKSKRNISLFGYAAVTGEDEKLWTSILNEPLPVNGVYLIAFLKTFIANSQGALENLIRKAWANKWTLQQLIAQATAPNPQDTPQGNSSELKKITATQAAVVATIMQHIAQQVSGGVTSLLFEKYEWVSVIDGRTSEICRELDNTRWFYGKGPLPPAHVNCRSNISPYVGTDDIPQETFYTWIKRQSEIFQKDVLGAANARLLREGKLKAENISKYESNQFLSLQGFEDKVNSILTI